MITPDRFHARGTRTLIPTGELLPVKGTPMDFTKPTAIGSRINQQPPPAAAMTTTTSSMAKPANWHSRPAAPIQEQAHDGSLDHRAGRAVLHWKFPGQCEGQGWRGLQKALGLLLGNAALSRHTKPPNFPSITLEPGQTYTQLTVHKFYVSK